MSGRLIAVVGPSGVGKDSVMDGLCAAAPQLRRVKRVITRAPGLGGEDYTPATEATFTAMVDAGEFAVHWGAHDLRYGIPLKTLGYVCGGAQCLANFSRTALMDAVRVFPALTVLNVTAAPETLAARLAGRGRETAEDIARRLARVAPLPPGLDVVTVSNDGALKDAVRAAQVALLHTGAVS